MPPKNPNSIQSRSFVFTINNPTSALVFNEEKYSFVRYCSWQTEKGATGTRHYQGYIEFNQPVRISKIKSLGGDWARAHLEVRRGTRDQARDYSRKEDSRLEGPWEFGEWDSGGAGKRTDLQGAVAMLKETGSLKRVAEEFPEVFVRNCRGLRELHDITSDAKRSWKSTVYVFYGNPGSGKSRLASELSGESVYFLRRGNSNSVWWDGYHGQDNVIIDDFYGWIPYDLLLRVCDRYECLVDYKGGATQLLAKKIFITSNRNPLDWYKFAEHKHMDPRAFQRRIDWQIRLDQGEPALWDIGEPFPLPPWIGTAKGKERAGEVAGGPDYDTNGSPLYSSDDD